jgi:hypothetical protein
VDKQQISYSLGEGMILVTFIRLEAEKNHLLHLPSALNRDLVRLPGLLFHPLIHEILRQEMIKSIHRLSFKFDHHCHHDSPVEIDQVLKYQLTPASSVCLHKQSSFRKPAKLDG